MHSKIKTPSVKDWFGVASPEKTDYPFPPEMLNKCFRFSGDPAKADVALVFVKGPMVNPGYDGEDVKKGGNG